MVAVVNGHGVVSMVVGGEGGCRMDSRRSWVVSVVVGDYKWVW